MFDLNSIAKEVANIMSINLDDLGVTFGYIGDLDRENVPKEDLVEIDAGIESNELYGFYLPETAQIILCGEHQHKLAVEIILAHELTHAQQFHSGRLDRLPDGSVIWEGLKYGRDELNISKVSKEQYLNLPWEIDANIQMLKYANKRHDGLGLIILNEIEDEVNIKLDVIREALA